MQEACRRAQTYCIVHFYHVIAFSSYSWSFEVLTFLWAFYRASTHLLVQCTYNFCKKLKFTEVCFESFFFDMNHNWILWTFWKFESSNSFISCVGGCQSDKSPFSARYEDGQLYYEGEWYVVLWLIYICKFVTAVHTCLWLLRLNHTPRMVFVNIIVQKL